jgi:hypothetical protein
MGIGLGLVIGVAAFPAFLTIVIPLLLTFVNEFMRENLPNENKGHIWTPPVSQGLMGHNYHLIPPRITDERKTVFDIYPASQWCV